MEKELTVAYKSKKFAIRIVNLYRYLNEEKKEYVLSKQLLRSGTSIEQILPKANVLSAKKIFFPKFILHLKKQMKQYIGLICFLRQKTKNVRPQLSGVKYCFAM